MKLRRSAGYPAPARRRDDIEASLECLEWSVAVVLVPPLGRPAGPERGDR
ncbi:MAG: hypothetical protein V2B18_22160 [Pseudomonadota bacterium]